MKVIIFTICIIISGSTLGVSQTDYAVTSKGDTLKGKVKIFTYDILDRVQVFVDKKKKMFTCLEVRGVSIDKEIFHTVKYEQGYRFMKIIKPGYLSLYGFRLPNQMSYDGQFLVKKDGSSMEIPNLTFKRSMAIFLGECKEVEERIKNGELGRKDIEQIIDRYNSCLQFKTEKLALENQVVINPAEDAKMIAINSLITKVEAGMGFTSKADVMDLLKDLRSKIGRNEILPNYLLKDIKNYLSTEPQYGNDIDKLLALLKK